MTRGANHQPPKARSCGGPGGGITGATSYQATDHNDLTSWEGLSSGAPDYMMNAHNGNRLLLPLQAGSVAGCQVRYE
jgi:hypothetical protein